MAELRVSNGISLDGYGAGVEQSLNEPLGINGMKVFGWFFHTPTFLRMHGKTDVADDTGVDERFAARGFENVGAWILGRNMFGPVRGPWEDENWKGWWGEEPPYHVPVFVLTHHARASITMQGGTVFHFVTDGIEAALARAMEAAGGLDVRLGGGVATVRQYLRAGLVDELHLAVSSEPLGRGENLLEGIDLVALGYVCTERVASEKATHVVLRRERKG